MHAISVENLSKAYTYHEKATGLKGSAGSFFRRTTLTKHAVRSISFEIEEGGIVGFIGPNGAGKTTTLKMLSGILYPTSGTASVIGFVPWQRKTQFKMQFSLVMGQKNQLWWDLPACDSFYLNKCIYELGDKEYAATLDELTALLDVKHLLRVQVRRLSLGERMKMELIAALLHKPRIMFLDEPTLGLDVVSQRRMRDFLKQYNAAYRTTIMLTSHYMDDIADLCKRVIVINHGTIVYDGDLDRLSDLFGQHKLMKLRFSSPVTAETLCEYGRLRDFDGIAATIEVPKCSVRERSRSALDLLPVVDCNIEDVPIEEAVSLLYQGNDHRRDPHA